MNSYCLQRRNGKQYGCDSQHPYKMLIAQYDDNSSMLRLQILFFLAIAHQIFILQPENTTAFERDNVTFDCDSVKPFRPHWKIDDGTWFNYDDLTRLGYIVDNTHLTLPDVRLNDDQRLFQCAFINDTHVNPSQTATLTVLKGMDNYA